MPAEQTEGDETPMAVRYCPECRHELAGRGRYCLFCGCDLRAAPPVSAEKPAGESAGSDRDRWNPDEAYRSRKSASVLLVVFLAVAAIAAAVFLAGYTDSSSKTPQLDLRAGMTFEEADALLQQNGFVPDGNPVSNAFTMGRMYRARKMYGLVAHTSELTVDSGKGGQVTLALYYRCDEGQKPASSATFIQLKKNLSSLCGDPVLYDSDTYYWPEEHGYRLLTAVGELVIVGEVFN